jgi:predicted DNA-binding protein
MKTMTVKLPDELAVRLEMRARRLGLSKSALVRGCVERDLRAGEAVEEAPSAYELMQGGSGLIDSGHSDLATNPDHMEGFGR